MANKMLIDATHPEETRVVVLRGNRVEEFDFEAANRKQLRGNIYLAKVTRVEPSLQAAFVDYGGNRHGFLAFSEIHPDYYQIPVADRQALLEDERMRRGSDDDFEPADDEAELQEIDDSDDDELDDSVEEAPEEEVKPRKARTSRSRTSRKRTPRSSDKSAAAELDAPAVAEAAASPEDAQPTSASDGDADTTDTKDPGDPGSQGDAASSEPDSSAEAGNDEQTDKIIPDRFLSAADDDDAVISGDVPEEKPENPESTATATDTSAATRKAAEDASAEQPQSDEPGDAEATDNAAETAPDDVNAVNEDPAEAIEASDDVSPPQTEEAGDEAAASSVDDADLSSETDDVASSDSDTEGAESENKAGQEQPQDGDDDQAVVTKTRRNQRNTESAPSRPRRRYKIQEVIKRRQIILVQVVKEERGTKGAALTTYLSLAGRYSVLMPNSPRGGGVSRKITNPGDRKRLKQIANELPVPDGMGVILRTAGASRTKTEVKRDFEYLMRLWENVRDLTLQSSAPALVYEEGNLVKRSIRDLYNKDIDEVLVAGDTGYREAKDFMRMLMPSHAKNVQPYKDQVPIFARNRVEPQLDAMFLPQVTLPSGGYIVINQTEALVAVDVNSGKATREHNIEDTALRTNVEAAEEMARQLRLRDLAGLIVIDFIDMEEKRNNRTVERKLKDCLKSDRARIQVGRISHFGLLEMSRQRLRTGVLESSTELCPHCHGTGVIRSTESVALHVLRSIEDQLLRSASHNLNVRIRTAVALYIINHKRYSLTDMEDRYGILLNLVADETIEDAYCIIDRSGIAESRRAPPAQAAEIVQPDTIDPDEKPSEIASEAVSEVAGEVAGEEEDADAPKKRRRKRRRRGRDAEGGVKTERSGDEQSATEDQGEDGDTDGEEQSDGEQETADADAREDAAGKKRRRGRRGGRRNKRGDEETESGEAQEITAQTDAANGSDPDADVTPGADQSDDSASEAPAIEASHETAVVSEPDEVAAETSADEPAPVPDAVETNASNEQGENGVLSSGAVPDSEMIQVAGANEEDGAAHSDETVGADIPSETVVPETPPEPDRPKKSGWWQKRSFFK